METPGKIDEFRQVTVSLGDSNLFLSDISKNMVSLYRFLHFLVGIIKKIEYNIDRYGYFRLRLMPALVRM